MAFSVILNTDCKKYVTSFLSRPRQKVKRCRPVDYITPPRYRQMGRANS